MRQRDWDMHPDGDGKNFTSAQHEQVTEIDSIRRRVIAPLEELRRNKDKTGRGRALALYNFLVEIGLEETLQRAEELGIADKVQYLGVRRDVAALMNAFDVFLLPSFFEGLPVVGIEAQATGLPVVTSTGVTPELPLEDLAAYLPLEESPQRWAQQVLDSARIPRRDTTQEIIDSGYDVRVAARVMQQKYEEMV